MTGKKKEKKEGYIGTAPHPGGTETEAGYRVSGRVMTSSEKAEL